MGVWSSMSYLSTGSGVSMQLSISSIPSSSTKCCRHSDNKLLFIAQPIGPKSYSPATPVHVCVCVCVCVSLSVTSYIYTVWMDGWMDGWCVCVCVVLQHTAIDRESWCIKEPPLECVI